MTSSLTFCLSQLEPVAGVQAFPVAPSLGMTPPAQPCRAELELGCPPDPPWPL